MKILITSVSTGFGHMKAAEALEATFSKIDPSSTATHINVMNYVTTPFRRFYEGGYSFVVERSPKIWGSIYELTDKKLKEKTSSDFLNSIQRLNARPFFECIEQFKPDQIITTHFFIPQILRSYREQKKLNIPIDCVITDFELHRVWVDDQIERYFVAHDGIASRLEEYGVPRKSIFVTGIPIHPDFIKQTNREKILSSLGLRSNIPTLLVLSGGLGFGAMTKTVEEIFDLKQKLQIITVSGKNISKRAELDSLVVPSHISLVNLGFVIKMDELIGAADIVITKAGGLTISECLAKGVGIIINTTIPGQEEKNANFLERFHAGIKVKTSDDLLTTLDELLLFPEGLNRLKHNARLLAKPYAGIHIAESIMFACTA